MRKMRRPDAADYHAAVGKGNPTIFDDVDGPPWYYAQWKESLKKKKTQQQTHKCREKTGGCQRWGCRTVERGRKVQTPRYKINKPWRCQVQHGDDS